MTVRDLQTDPQMKPFSVLISIYQRENPDYIQKALESIWDNQSIRPSEIILVQDGPLTANLEAVIKKWKDKVGEHLQIVSLPVNRGLSVALNKGLDACSHDLVARMDGDDIALPKRFERQLNIIGKKPDIDICGTWATYIDEHENPQGERIVPEDDKQIKEIAWACPIIHPTVIIRKKSIQKIGSYDPDSPHRQEDYELWIRAALSGLKFTNIQEPLLLYRVGRDHLSKNTLQVGIDRFRIGLPAVRRFNNKPAAYLALAYPIVRGALPRPLDRWLDRIAQHADPKKITQADG